MVTNFDNKYNFGSVQYGYSRAMGKWEFRFPVSGTEFSLLLNAGGKVKAAKVASIITGALKRKGELDGLARANIERILA